MGRAVSPVARLAPRPPARCARGRGARRVAALALLGAAWLTPATGSADQDAPRLDPLFEELADADDAVDARRLEAEIWRAWLEPPDEDASLLMGGVTDAMTEGDLERALELADRLVELAPDYAEGWNKRATILFVMGDDDASVADIRETLAREPRHFGAISGLGQIFLRRGEPGAALEAFEEVLRLSPASPNARAAVEFARAARDEREI